MSSMTKGIDFFLLNVDFIIYKTDRIEGICSINLDVTRFLKYLFTRRN